MRRAIAFLTATVALLVAWVPAAQAQSVTLVGMLGGRALIIVDGNAPKLVAVGDSHLGVKVVSTQGDRAVFDIAGKQHALQVGESPASVTRLPSARPASNRITMTAGSGGHFSSTGQINGRAVQLLVDTGATAVSLGVDDAIRLGLNYKVGQPVQMSTANGVTNGWRIKLANMRVGDVEVYDVDAVVTPGAMPYVLLGNSFLSRFQMTRTNDLMVLEKRF